MKAGWLLAAIFASIVAGAGGGYVAVQYASPAQNTPNKVAAADPMKLDTVSESKGTTDDGDLAKLRQDIQNLQVRLDKAETDKKNLEDSIEALNTKLAKAEKAKPAEGDVVTNDDGSAIDTSTPEGKAAVAAIVEEEIKRRDEERAKQREEDQKKRMEDWAASRNKQIVDKLATELSLTDVQKTNIETVLTDMSTKRGEVMERGRTARDNGEEFDWGAEMKVVNDAALEAVKAELSSAQVSTLNSLLGEDGSLDALAGGWGGGRGNGGRRGGRD